MKKHITILALAAALLFVGAVPPVEAQTYKAALTAITTSTNSAFIQIGGAQNVEVYARSTAGSTSSIPIQMCAAAVSATCYTVATITNVAAAGAWYNGPSEPYLYIPATVSAGTVTVLYATNNGTRLQGWKRIEVVPSSLGAVVLTSDVSGTLPVVNGGTALTTGTSGGVLGYTGAGTLASSVLLTNHAIVLGAGAGATLTPLGSLGTNVTVLHGAAAGPPTFGAVVLTTDVSGILPVANGGSGSAAAKALVESSATIFATVTVATGHIISGHIEYGIEADDATDFQGRAGIIPFSAVNKAGTITCTVGTVTTATEIVAVSTGTLANTFTCADATGGVLNLLANAVSSLTQSTLQIRPKVYVNGTATIAYP